MTTSPRQRARELAAEMNQLASVGLLDAHTLDHLRREALDLILELDRAGELDTHVHHELNA